MELWRLCVRVVGQVRGRVRITIVVHRDASQKAVGYAANLGSMQKLKIYPRLDLLIY